MRPRSLQYVLHPTDFTEGDHSAFVHSLAIALTAKGQLQLLHVKDSEQEVRWSDFPHVRSTLSKWGLLPSAAPSEELTRLGLRVVKVQLRAENPSQKISQYIAGHHPNLVVLSTHQRQGLDRLLHHSLAEPIARSARTMTLFIPRYGEGSTGKVCLRHILIPGAKTPAPQAAVQAAALLARTLKCPDVNFTLLHVGSESDMPEIDTPSPAGWAWERRTWAGNVVDHILDSAAGEKADLIIMATHGHQGFLDALRGSTTERIVRLASCPVLAVPAS